jgi:hypothetical protein
MTPKELHSLQQLALAHGGSLTINPETGLPEAGFLSSILPVLAGFALNAFLPGAGLAVGSLLGAGEAVGTGLLIGGGTAALTGDLKQGLMAGIGAYGGAGLASGVMGAGSSTLAAEQAAAQQAANAGATHGAFLESAGSAHGAFIPGATTGLNAASASPMETLIAGGKSLGTEAGRASALSSMGGGMGALKY